MPRPEFPIGTILPVGAIHRIRDEQEYYDRNPERYEREQQQRRERQRRETEEERDIWEGQIREQQEEAP